MTPSKATFSVISEQGTLPGPAGRLQTVLDLPKDAPVIGTAVVCHPHPLHGGTMHNKVAYTLGRAFAALGFAALRFNFRGTEGSEGRYDDGRGELEDAKFAFGWLTDRYPGVPHWLAGFSFGAAIAIRAAVTEQASGLISVAPPVGRIPIALDGQPACPWLIVQGDRDEIIAVDGTIAWVNSLEPGPELMVLPGAEHFFHGKLTALRDAVQAFVAEQVEVGH